MDTRTDFRLLTIYPTLPILLQEILLTKEFQVVTFLILILYIKRVHLLRDCEYSDWIVTTLC